MPLRFWIDHEKDLVVTTAEGEVTAADLMDHARALAATPDRPTRELVDLSERAEIPVPTDAVRQMARFLADADANTPGSRVALVAKTDALYGMLRLYQAHREHPSVAMQVFRDRAAALRWLDGSGD